MKNVITVLFTVCFISGFAQTFQGKATYKTHRKVSLEMKDSKGGVNSDMQKQLQERLRKLYQKTYTLNFSKSESTYKQNQELSAPKQNGMDIMVMGGGGVSDILYKNITEKRFSKKTEISGKRFLIKDDLKDYSWKLTGETKNIGIYTCYKATAEMKVEDEDMEGETDEKTVITTAWYTLEIPVSSGPGKYWGLPGLILEIQEGKNTIVCSEIVLNPSDKIKIKEPKKGKKITQGKFDKVMKQKSEEMIERFKNRRKSKNGSSFTIDIK